jgi:hypothetical protein
MSNAVQAARRLGYRSTVGLSLRLFRDHLIAEVIDSSPAVPVLTGPARSRTMAVGCTWWTR